MRLRFVETQARSVDRPADAYGVSESAYTVLQISTCLASSILSTIIVILKILINSKWVCIISSKTHY